MIQTHGVKYIGSKKDLLPYIGEVFSRIGATTAIDVFAGTTRVSQYLRQTGIQCDTSDLSWATSCYAATFVHNGDNTHLQEFVDRMNALTGVRGWLTENYTGEGPESADRSDGRCFQSKNTMKADAARDYVETLNLEPWEKATLVTSIIRGLDAVDNTVGIQQAYLKNWCSRSYKDVLFTLPPCLEGPTGVHLEGDALKLSHREADVAYLDPPYSPHSYATYYHIWDSIARWDKPPTALKARRRIDRVAKSEEFDGAMSSDWNSKRTALSAFESLIGNLPTNKVVVSYSDESIVAKSDLIAMCEGFGSVQIDEIDYSRHIMSQIGNADGGEKGQKNKELLITITRS